MTPPSDRGSVSAEFVAALPAVIATAALLLGGVQVGAATVRAQAVAASAAREIARGDDPGAVVASVTRQLPGSSVARRSSGGLACVRVVVRPAGPLGAAGVRAAAESCAAEA